MSELGIRSLGHLGVSVQTKDGQRYMVDYAFYRDGVCNELKLTRQISHEDGTTTLLQRCVEPSEIMADYQRDLEPYMKLMPEERVSKE